MKKYSSFPCRVTGQHDLVEVVDLGIQALQGHFPQKSTDKIPEYNLALGLSESSGLLQLIDNAPIPEMYGSNYGYRSGLNKSMVCHLEKKVQSLMHDFPCENGAVVLDIGSNDGTLLSFYSDDLIKIGIDPTIDKFKSFYEPNIITSSNFFDASEFFNISPAKKASIITSCSMLYDLPSPVQFCADIASVLDDNGIWHFEQSYVLSMLRTNSYDTICHEHLEYYSMKVIIDILDKAGLRPLDVSFNSINGGSFAVTASHQSSSHQANSTLINWILSREHSLGLASINPYLQFQSNIDKHKEEFKGLLNHLNSNGQKVAGYGASTKGNVILQYCQINSEDIFAIAEVNPDKFNCFTPASNIPILSEDSVFGEHPDYMVVLPWHFRDTIIQRESDYLRRGGKLIFPLPYLDIVG